MLCLLYYNPLSQFQYSLFNVLPAYEDDCFDLQRHDTLIKLQIAFLLLQGGAVANTGVSQQEGSRVDPILNSQRY